MEILKGLRGLVLGGALVRLDVAEQHDLYGLAARQYDALHELCLFLVVFHIHHPHHPYRHPISELERD